MSRLAVAMMVFVFIGQTAFSDIVSGFIKGLDSEPAGLAIRVLIICSGLFVAYDIMKNGVK